MTSSAATAIAIGKTSGRAVSEAAIRTTSADSVA